MKSKNAAIFLDRDGTINEDYGYVYKNEDLCFIDGVIEGLKMLQDAGYLLIVITNQSGVARGYFTIEEMDAFHSYMLYRLKQQGIDIAKVYCCPHLEGCDCRKPKLQLFYKAQEEFEIDFNQSYVIGDKYRDLSLCEVENVKGYLLDLKEKEPQNRRGNITKCKDLLEATKMILSN